MGGFLWPSLSDTHLHLSPALGAAFQASRRHIPEPGLERVVAASGFGPLWASTWSILCHVRQAWELSTYLTALFTLQEKPPGWAVSLGSPEL